MKPLDFLARFVTFSRPISGQITRMVEACQSSTETEMNSEKLPGPGPGYQGCPTQHIYWPDETVLGSKDQSLAGSYFCKSGPLPSHTSVVFRKYIEAP